MKRQFQKFRVWGKKRTFGIFWEKKNQMTRVARKSMTMKEQLDYMYSQAQLFLYSSHFCQMMRFECGNASGTNLIDNSSAFS